MATFSYFGEDLTYAEEFPAFEYAEFAEALSEDEVDNTRATGVALRLAVACVAEEDRGKFRKLSRQNRAKVEDWLRVFRDWTADAAERPTGQPIDSSDGHESTPQTSDSPPVATVTPIGVVTEFSPDESGKLVEVRRETEAAQPRPRGDLALAASRSQTA